MNSQVIPRAAAHKRRQQDGGVTTTVKEYLTVQNEKRKG